MPNPTVRFETSLGAFTVEVFADAMPATSRNFLKLVRSGFYDGLHFHRIIRGFMAQFGCPHSRDPESTLAGTGESPYGTIADEFPAAFRLSNEPLTLSMANTGGPNTGSCQFFINTAHNAELDWFTPGPSRHPVFGKVSGGAEIIRKIDQAPMGTGTRPRTPIAVLHVTVNEVEAPPEEVAPTRPSTVAQASAPSSAPPKRAAAGSDPWTILGVKRGASADEIKRAFALKSSDFAPERLSQLSSRERRLAEEELQRITVAFQIIGP